MRRSRRQGIQRWSDLSGELALGVLKMGTGVRDVVCLWCFEPVIQRDAGTGLQAFLTVAIST
jgi:hypothetical protein